jgi:predicted nucleic-acid-binding protein
MKITVDTNVLVRSVLRDDEKQAGAAEKVLKEATAIAVALPVLCEFLCEFVWVLRKVYDLAPADIATAVRVLLDTRNLVVNRPAAEAGLAILDAGGDFADGVIAYEGIWLGGETFVSFDNKAVVLLKEQRHSATLLSG